MTLDKDGYKKEEIAERPQNPIKGDAGSTAKLWAVVGAVFLLVVLAGAGVFTAMYIAYEENKTTEDLQERADQLVQKRLEKKRLQEKKALLMGEEETSDETDEETNNDEKGDISNSSKADSKIIPANRLDIFLLTDSYQSVRAKVGAKNIESTGMTSYDEYEGPFFKVYPNQPHKEFYVSFYPDGGSLRYIIIERLDNSPVIYKAPQEITIGTTLKTLVRLNKKHFKVHGWGNEKQGQVVYWDKGMLHQSLKGMTVYLAPSFDSLQSQQAIIKPMYVDQIFDSRDARLQDINPVINRMVLSF